MRRFKWSSFWTVAWAVCVVLVFIETDAALFWLLLTFVCMWRSDFHQVSEQLLEIKERLDK